MKNIWGILLICYLIDAILCNDTKNLHDDSVNETNFQRISMPELKFRSDLQNDGIWSRLLEDFTLGKSNRNPKFVQHPMNYISQPPPPPPSPSSPMLPIQNQYMAAPPTTSNQSPFMMQANGPVPSYFITKRVGEAMELEPHMRPPGKVISPGTTAGGGVNIPPLPPSNPTNFPLRQAFIQNQPLREVSETDLYLLGAIEKLVYRVDYLEHRLRRSEQLIYYLMAGNKQKDVPDPCPMNFTRIGENCYHVDGDRQVNWKTANGICKSLGSYLAEFEKLSENEDIVAYLLNHPSHRGKDFWLGGLNPGLLWIWSNSAKPVNPNTNLTFVANSVGDNLSSSTSTSGVNHNINEKINNNNSNRENEKIVNNSNDIKGSGRCLRLSYNPAKHSYFYYGQECTSRHHILCEYQDKTLDNKIKRISRELKLD